MSDPVIPERRKSTSLYQTLFEDLAAAEAKIARLEATIARLTELLGRAWESLDPMECDDSGQRLRQEIPEALAALNKQVQRQETSAKHAPVMTYSGPWGRTP